MGVEQDKELADLCSKPLDASDMETTEQALAEVKRIREVLHRKAKQLADGTEEKEQVGADAGDSPESVSADAAQAGRRRSSSTSRKTSFDDSTRSADELDRIQEMKALYANRQPTKDSVTPTYEDNILKERPEDPNRRRSSFTPSPEELRAIEAAYATIPDGSVECEKAISNSRRMSERRTSIGKGDTPAAQATLDLIEREDSLRKMHKDMRRASAGAITLPMGNRERRRSSEISTARRESSSRITVEKPKNFDALVANQVDMRRNSRDVPLAEFDISASMSLIRRQSASTMELTEGATAAASVEICSESGPGAAPPIFHFTHF